MSSLQPVPPRRSALRALGTWVVLVGLVALAGWLLLLLVKGVVVLTAYAVGVLLIVVPLLSRRRLLGRRVGRDRWERRGAIAGAVALGIALCLVAHLLARHGWLLVAVPAAVVAASRAATALAARQRS